MLIIALSPRYYQSFNTRPSLYRRPTTVLIIAVAYIKFSVKTQKACFCVKVA
ncbi:hypothetical protein HMPREF3214_01542 [Alloscardovia omnicolens]|nr:hypothetical protein HMPREF3214_01542 [Alloscardovia omnicolens]